MNLSIFIIISFVSFNMPESPKLDIIVKHRKPEYSPIYAPLDGGGHSGNEYKYSGGARCLPKQEPILIDKTPCLDTLCRMNRFRVVVEEKIHDDIYATHWNLVNSIRKKIQEAQTSRNTDLVIKLHSELMVILQCIKNMIGKMDPLELAIVETIIKREDIRHINYLDNDELE